MMAAQGPVDDTRIYDIYIAMRGSAALAVAVRLGLFEELARAPSGVAALSVALQTSERGMRSLCCALQGLGLIQASPEGFCLAPDSAQFLVSGQRGYLGQLIDADYDLWLSPASLMKAVKDGRPAVYGAEDMWQEHARDPARAAQFADMMTAVSGRAARALAERAPLSGRSHLLDVGAGTGIFIIEALRAHAGLRATAYDIAAMIPLAQRAISAAGVEGRTSFVAGDMFAEAWPTGVDVVLLS